MGVLKRIAVVDDDIFYMEHFMMAVKAEGYDIIYFKTVPLFLDALNEGNKFDLYIIDLAMPPTFDLMMPPDETESGLLTGLYLTKEIRRTYDAQNPIIIFSQIHMETVIDGVKEEIKDEDNIAFVSKHDMLPRELSSVVGTILDKGLKSFTQSGFLSKVFDIIILQPNIYGIGLDFKKFRKR